MAVSGRPGDGNIIRPNQDRSREANLIKEGRKRSLISDPILQLVHDVLHEDMENQVRKRWPRAGTPTCMQQYAISQSAPGVRMDVTQKASKWPRATIVRQNTIAGYTLCLFGQITTRWMKRVNDVVKIFRPVQAKHQLPGKSVKSVPQI